MASKIITKGLKRTALSVALGMCFAGSVYAQSNSTGSIAGTVFRDDNNNGTQDGGEVGISGTSVTLEWSGADGDFGTLGDNDSVTILSDASGNYVFDFSNTSVFYTGFGDTTAGLLSTGIYRLIEIQPAGFLDGADNVGNAATPGTAVGFALLTCLALLAVLEHLFMVLPLPDEKLWRWMMPARKTPTPRMADRLQEDPHGL